MDSSRFHSSSGAPQSRSLVHLACIASLLVVLSLPVAATWSVVSINTSSSINEGMHPSAAVDSSGYLRVAFLRTSSYDLMYYYRTWAGGLVETAVSAGNVGQYCSMALNSSDVPYVSYFNDSTNALDYAWRNGSWDNAVATISVQVNSTSLDLDSSDRLHISYTATSDSNLHYKWNSGTWQSLTFSTTFNYVSECSLALDTADHPHVAYQFGDGTDVGVRYSHHDGSSWSHEIIEQATAFCGNDPSVAVGSSDLPQITYGSQDLKRAWYDGSDWHTEVVDDVSNPNFCLFTSLALDGMDRPHIAYIVYNATLDLSSLKYTWYDGSSWHPETIETMAGQAPCSMSLVLGGSSYIAYYDPNLNNGKLKYASYNHPPIADAGPDLYVVDTAAAGWGTEPVDLDGTGSYDPDGSLTAYSWKEGATEIATAANPTVNLTLGTHDIDLVVTDDNSTDSPSDGIVVELVSPTAAVFRVDAEGRVFNDATFYAASFASGSADIAEWVAISGGTSSGDVLELDPLQRGVYRRSRSACSALVAGVVSTAPGLALGASGPRDSQALLALTGIVPVKVTGEGGPIMPGDLLVSSSVPGHAMRWSGPGPCPCALVGKALQPMTDERGVILVLLTAH